MSSSDPCIAKGFNYYCNTPQPSSAFIDRGILCPAVSQFLYDPSNCDPGYWCGCTTIIEEQCLPTNNYTTTNWIGHFTTTDATTGETIVLEGLAPFINEVSQAGNINIKCPDGFYCPGFDDANRCVDLCPPKSYCEDPGVAVECPKDKFCPIGTTVPLDCEGLQMCEEGLRRPTSTPAMGVIFIVLIVAVVHLFVVRCIVNRKERKAKNEKMANMDAHKEVDHTHDTDPNWKGAKKVTAPEMTIDIEYTNMSLTIPNVGTIMRDVSGILKHGELTAIMGPSGSGKSTFLNLMSGKVDRTDGTIKINGEEVELTRFRKIIGFVPQEDTMMRNLTVEDNIRHSALMRLPTNWSLEEKLARIDETVESLEIAHVRDSVVGDENRRGVSGGQRKRVNIGIEMVMKPSLLCLDEPTSGLDSTTSFTVLQSLKDMANSGVNVIAVLHQPKYEIFNLFDKVLFLGKGGRIIYHGERAGVVEYFENRGFPLPSFANPADYYMDVLSGIIPHATDPDFTPDDLVGAWLCAPQNPFAVSPKEAESLMLAAKREDSGGKAQKKNLVSAIFSSIGQNLREVCLHLCSDMRAGESGRKTPGTFRQFILLFKRTYLQRVRNPWGSVLTIVLMTITGQLIGNIIAKDSLLYNGIPKGLTEGDDPFWGAYLKQNVKPVDQVPAILSTVYFFLLIVSCLSVNIFGQERAVFFRDTASGQKVVSYWAGKTLETFIWVPLYGAAFAFLGYFNEAWFLQSLLEYWVFFFLNIMGFYGIGMTASLILGSSAALLALVFGIIVILFFGGTVGEAPAPAKAFFVFWSTQGLSINEYEIYKHAFDIEALNAASDTDGADELGAGLEKTVGAGVGSNFDLDAGFAKNAGFCFVCAFAWHLIVLWTLKTRHHKKQR